MKKESVANLGEEELTRVKRVIRTRNETRAEADVMFGTTAQKQRQVENEMMKKLFIQFPASVTMQPSLQKLSSVNGEPVDQTPPLSQNVDAFFEKRAYLTDAQRRYPELQKVAALPTPGLNKGKPLFQNTIAKSDSFSGPTPTPSPMSKA